MPLTKHASDPFYAIMRSSTAVEADKLLKATPKSAIIEWINERREQGNTVLHKAVLGGGCFWDVVIDMLKLNADPTIENNDKQTAIQLAKKDGVLATLFQPDKLWEIYQAQLLDFANEVNEYQKQVIVFWCEKLAEACTQDNPDLQNFALTMARTSCHALQALREGQNNEVKFQCYHKFLETIRKQESHLKEAAIKSVWAYNYGTPHLDALALLGFCYALLPNPQSIYLVAILLLMRHAYNQYTSKSKDVIDKGALLKGAYSFDTLLRKKFDLSIKRSYRINSAYQAARENQPTLMQKQEPRVESTARVDKARLA